MSNYRNYFYFILICIFMLHCKNPTEQIENKVKDDRPQIHEFPFLHESEFPQVPANWRKIENEPTISFQMPQNMNFEKKKEPNLPGGLRDWGMVDRYHYIIEKGEISIISSIIFVNINDVIENERHDSFCVDGQYYKLNFQKRKGYLIECKMRDIHVDTEFFYQFSFMIPSKKYKNSTFFVYLRSLKISPEAIETARKILFSIKVKDEQL